MTKGTCKHGEFDLREGCPLCIEEERTGVSVAVQTNIVKVQYEDMGGSGFHSREYSYYSEDRLKVGDIVRVLLGGRIARGTVTAIDVPESEVEAFKDKMKTIPADSVIPPEAEVNSPENIGKRIREAMPTMEQVAENFAAVTEELRGPSVVETTGDGTGVKVITTADPGYRDVEPITAVVLVDPGSTPSFARHLEAARRVLEIAKSCEIRTEADAKAVNDDLNVMAELEKATDAERKTFTVPLNGYLSSINGEYKLITDPLTEAKQIYRKLLTAWKVEQQRKAAAAEKLNRDAIELARRQAEANQGEFTVEVKPVPVPFAPKLTRTDQGKSGLVDNWKYEITDVDEIPRPYMIADHALLSSTAKIHHDKKVVKGVRFYNEPGLRVTK